MPIFLHDARALLTREGLMLPNGKLSSAYPRIKAALKAIEQHAAGDMTLEQAQILRRTLGLAAKSPDGAEGRLGRLLEDQFFDFIGNLPPVGWRGGDGARAAELWRIGRSEWARFRRTETIEAAITRAQRAKGGFAEGLKSQFRTILNSPKKSRGFSEADLAAMDKFVQGGPIEDLLQVFSQGGALPISVLGHLAAGPVGAVAAAGGRLAPRGALNRGARKVGEQIRSSVAGGPLPGPRLPPTVGPRTREFVRIGTQGQGALQGRY